MPSRKSAARLAVAHLAIAALTLSWAQAYRMVVDSKSLAMGTAVRRDLDITSTNLAADKQELAARERADSVDDSEGDGPSEGEADGVVAKIMGNHTFGELVGEYYQNLFRTALLDDGSQVLVYDSEPPASAWLPHVNPGKPMFLMSVDKLRGCRIRLPEVEVCSCNEVMLGTCSYDHGDPGETVNGYYQKYFRVERASDELGEEGIGAQVLSYLGDTSPRVYLPKYKYGSPTFQLRYVHEKCVVYQPGINDLACFCNDVLAHRCGYEIRENEYGDQLLYLGAHPEAMAAQLPSGGNKREIRKESGWSLCYITMVGALPNLENPDLECYCEDAIQGNCQFSDSPGQADDGRKVRYLELGRRRVEFPPEEAYGNRKLKFDDRNRCYITKELSDTCACTCDAVLLGYCEVSAKTGMQAVRKTLVRSFSFKKRTKKVNAFDLCPS